MLRNWKPHSEYQTAISAFIINYNDRNRLLSFDKSISKLYLLNLDKVYDVIKSCYPDWGRPAKNQQAIIRSLTLMLDQKNHAITCWAEKVQCDKLLSTICGFDGKASGIASYYDFIDRLWLNNDKYKKSEKSKLKHFESKPKKKLKQNEKLPPKHPGSVARIVDKAKLDKLRTRSLEKFMQLIMKVCVVIPSAERGLLGNVNAFTVAFDGTPYYSGASPYGNKVCKCKEKGIYACKCDRKFSDPDARWGWDSYRKQWFYGNTLFNVSAADSDYDLPIFFKLVEASRHDSITSIFALLEIRKLYPEFKIANFIADGAMDNYATYSLLEHFNIIPFISLDERSKMKMKNESDPFISGMANDSSPLCPAGRKYTYWGICTPYRLKFRCPFAAKGKPIPNDCKCSDSTYGKTVYLKPSNDPRLYPPVKRHTALFKSMFKKRTTVERINKRQFNDYDIEHYGSRSVKLRAMLTLFANINIHLDAWCNDFSLLKQAV